MLFFIYAVIGMQVGQVGQDCCTLIVDIHRVHKKGATDFFAVTFTNIDGFS